MELCLSVRQLICPKLDKVLQNSGGDVDAVQHGVRQKQHKELIVGESDTVINPGTMVIHFQDTFVAGGAVMASVWFNQLTSVTITDSSRACACIYRQISGHSFQDFLLTLWSLLLLIQLFFCLRETELFGGANRLGNDGLPVGPHEDKEEDVKHYQINNLFLSVSDCIYTELHHVSVVGPAHDQVDKNDRYPG